MIGGTAPDVFTDHLAKYPEFASKNQLVDIQPYIDRDKVDLSVYLSGLADLWGRDGKRFGLPKDWDTIAIVYNKDMLDKAGVTVDEVSNATWNPDDGGTFAQLIAKLTLDENGKNALDSAFDKTKVAQYGLIVNGAGEGYGQTEWSWLTNTTGWKHIDNLYATAYHYDDPRFIKTIQWYADMMAASKMMPLELVTSLGGAAAFEAGKGALQCQRLVDDRRLCQECNLPLRLRPPAQGAGRPQEHVQRPGGLDLDRLQASRSGLGVGEVPGLGRLRQRRG